MVGLCRYKERSSMEMEHDKTFCFTCAIFHVFAHCIVTEISTHMHCLLKACIFGKFISTKVHFSHMQILSRDTGMRFLMTSLSLWNMECFFLVSHIKLILIIFHYQSDTLVK